MKTTLFIATILVALSLASCVLVQAMMPNHADKWSSTSHGKYRDYKEYGDSVISKYPTRVIGTFDVGVDMYSVYEVSIDNGSDKDVLIFGGMHGDEPCGVLSTIRFVEGFRKEAYTKNYNYKIVSVVNPWGWEHNTRYNADGYDINRDFSTNEFNTKESKIIVDAYKSSHPAIVIDNHESNWTDENYFFVYNSQSESLIREFIEHNVGYKYDNKSNYVLYRANKGIIRIDSGILGLVKDANRWALSNYFLTKTPNVIVIESGSMNTSTDERIKFHLDAMDYIINDF